MRGLDARYRMLLRWYPRAWRAPHGEAFVGTALDVADAEGRTAPTIKEVASIAAHGMNARMNRLIEPRVRDAASTIALTAGAGVALTVFLVSSWAPWAGAVTRTILDSPSVSALAGWLRRAMPLPTVAFHDTGFIFATVWLVAFVAALAGWWMVGRVALLCGIALGAATPYLFPGWAAIESLDGATLILLSSCAALAIIGRPFRGAGTAGATLGWALLVGVAFGAPGGSGGVWLSSGALWGQVGVIWYAAAVLLVAAVSLAVARRWIAAFAIVLGLLPLAVTLVVAEIRGIVVGSGSPEVIAVPVAVGLLLLALWSSGRLALPDVGPSSRTIRARPRFDGDRGITG
jgi:hypothetical protein